MLWILFCLAVVAGCVWFGVEVRRASDYVEAIRQEEARRVGR